MIKKFKQFNESALDLVPCPNNCLDGQVKYYPNPEKALFDMTLCPYCKGKGEVTSEEATEFNAR